MWRDSTAQFADCLTERNWALECRATATFDEKASRLPGFIAARPLVMLRYSILFRSTTQRGLTQSPQSRPVNIRPAR